MRKKRKPPAQRKKRAAPRRPRRAAPVELPALDPKGAGEQAMLRVRRVETIEAAYQAWFELRLEHSGTVLKLADERRRLEQQGEFLVGAVRAARDLSHAPTVDEALVLARKGDGLDAFVLETAARLDAAKAELEQRSRAAQGAFGEAFAAIREEVRARVVRTVKHVKPRLRLMIRALGPENRILHLGRLGPDEAVLLAWVLLEKLPSRYGFLFDDSTDDATKAPPTLYAEEGVSSALIRPTPQQLQALVLSKQEVVPIKSVIPFVLPRSGEAAQLARLVERGPVMEVELAAGPEFRNVLSRDEAERVAGYLLRLKLEQKIEIELVNS